MIRLLVFFCVYHLPCLQGGLQCFYWVRIFLCVYKNEASYRNFTLQLIITFPPYQLIERMFFILIACYTKLLMYECIKKEEDEVEFAHFNVKSLRNILENVWSNSSSKFSFVQAFIWPAILCLIHTDDIYVLNESMFYSHVGWWVIDNMNWAFNY